MSPIPVLTYHAFNISGDTYQQNDHIAFATDLGDITELGWRVEPLHTVVDAYLGKIPPLPGKVLAITFDDATNYDFEDLTHPSATGLQRSMLNIMRDFQARHPGAQPHLHATSFAIASPAARQAIDKAAVFGNDWMQDAWWQEAVASELMDIANHSWDHTHDSVDPVAQRDQIKGNFFCIDNEDDANAQIRRAAKYISGVAPNASVDLFAFPYGHTNPFLLENFLRAQANSALPCVRAAFTTEAGMITEASNRWSLPRYVCGWHWHSPEELREILNL